MQCKASDIVAIKEDRSCHWLAQAAIWRSVPDEGSLTTAKMIEKEVQIKTWCRLGKNGITFQSFIRGLLIRAQQSRC